MFSTGAFFASIIEPIVFKRKVIWYEILFGIVVIIGVFIVTQSEIKYLTGIILGIVSAFLASLFAVFNGKFSEKNTALNKTTEENNKDLSLGKKMNQFVTRFKPGTKNKDLIEEVLKFLAVETSRKNKTSKKPADVQKRRPNHRSNEIKVGSVVKLRSGKEKGAVISLQGKNATVLFGAFKTRVKVDKLSLVK